jgi:hypothetical protein
MKAFPSLALLLLVFTSCATGAWAAGSVDPSGAALREDLHFTESAPYSSVKEIQRRFGVSDSAPEYDVAHEKFQAVIPRTYSTNASWGLLVWISAGDDMGIPSNLEPALAGHHMLLVAACVSGNNRDVIDRWRLALDAAFGMCHRYRIDYRRLYVGGFSGGGRVASSLAVAYGDVFTGLLSVCGVDFYQHLPATAGGYYLASYKPDPGVLQLAKARLRLVLLTGDKDMNRDNVQSTTNNGFKRNGFKNVYYLEIAGMSHALPWPDSWSKALDLLTGSKVAN